MKRFHYMNAYIDNDFTDGTIRFISYNSGTLDILDDTLTFYKHWNYSSSTRRQLTRFLSEKLNKHISIYELRECEKQFTKTSNAMLYGYNVIFSSCQPMYY